MITGIDIAWARPTIAQIKATGAHWVARYFSPDNTKNLHADEVTAYAAAGLGIVTVWEGTASRALAGFTAGQNDARAAAKQRAAVGLPAEMPIYFAVDTDTTWDAVHTYFAGVASVLGAAHVGVYGGYQVIQGAANAGYRYLWQTIAWSHGQWCAQATIRQTGGTCLQGSADYDQAVVDDFGQFPRPEVDMPLTQADADLLAQTLTAPNNRDAFALATLYWLDKALSGQPLPDGTPAGLQDACTRLRGSFDAAVKAAVAEATAVHH